MVHTLPEEERHLLEMVEGFVATDLRPRAHEVDRDDEIPADLLRHVTRMDLWGLAMPAATGGSGRSSRTALLVVEELARGSAALGVLAAVHDTAAWVLGQRPEPHAAVEDAHHGHARFTGVWPTVGTTGLWCHRHTPDAPHVLTGSTPVVPGAADADHVLVGARCGARGRDDLVLVVVPAGTDGVTTGPSSTWTGLRGSGARALLFDRCEVTPADVVEERPGVGEDLATAARARLRRAIAAVGVGLAQSGLDGARIHARTAREAGSPLHDHETVRMSLAEMATAVEATRALQRSAADRADHGVGTTRLAAMARRDATRTAVDVVRRSIDVHGELGASVVVPMERLLRDAITLGTVLDTDRRLLRDIADSLVPT